MANANLICALVLFGVLCVLTLYLFFSTFRKYVVGKTASVYRNLVAWMEKNPTISLEDRNSHVPLMNAKQLMEEIPSETSRAKRE